MPNYFFIPATKDAEITAQTYEAIKKFATETTGGTILDKKIFSIQYKHHGKSQYAEVGKFEDLTNDVVIAILETEKVYLVCTRYRGVIRDMPILVGKHETLRTILFDN